jgi:ABC-2 type transport system permease protein
MTAALHAEFLKLGTTRLVAAMTGLAVALTALIGVLEAITAGTGKGMAIPSLATAGGLRDNLASTGFALLVAALLGVSIASGEFRLKTATDTYLDQPCRARVLAAKAVAAAAAGAVLGTAAAAAATAIALGFAASRGYPIALSDPAIARYTGGAVVGSALLAATGVGAGSLIRHQVGATIAVVAWALVIELVVGATLTTVGRFLPYTAASMMAGDTNGGGMPQIPHGVTALPYPAAIAVLIAIAVAVAATAASTTVHRDVT